MAIPRRRVRSPLFWTVPLMGGGWKDEACAGTNKSELDQWIIQVLAPSFLTRGACIRIIGSGRRGHESGIDCCRLAIVL